MLVEAMVVTTMATLSFIGLVSVFIHCQRSYEAGVEESTVVHAVRRTVAQMRSENFGEIGSLYSTYEFSVPGVNYSSGTTTLYFDETADVPELGLPRDLDGDGSADNKNVSGGYVLLPVRVDVTWTGMRGTETRSLYAFLSDQS